jgi:hypothetical protein
MNDPTRQSLSTWETDVAISMAQVELGDIVPAEPMLLLIRETIARLKGERSNDRLASSHR